MNPLVLSWMSAALASPSARCLSASHQGDWTGEGVRWRSTLQLDRAVGEVALATPLPADAALILPPGVAEVIDGSGQVVGLAVDGSTSRVELELRQPGARDRLTPPLCAGELPQRVVLRGAGFRPDPALGLAHHVGSWSTPELRGLERAQLERQLERTFGAADGRPILLGGDRQVAALGGLPGQLLPAGERSSGVTTAVATIFTAVVAALLGMWRALAGPSPAA